MSQDIRPARYCLGCSYVLDGLPENRCPECGRPFEPNDPTTFRMSPRRAGMSLLYKTRPGRIALVAASLVVLTIILDLGVDFGRRYESCARCGAESRVRHLVLFGFGGDYGRTVTEGAVSRFIQEQDNARCVHQWQAFDLYGGTLFRRWAGTGRGLHRAIVISNLESACPSVTEFLRMRAREDPAFLPQLKAALEGDDDASRTFLEQLLQEALDWSNKRAPFTNTRPP